MYIKSIYEMNVLEEGIIVELRNFDPHTRHRFLDLGIAPKCNITLLKRINFKNLYLIEVDDIEFCIRKADAMNVMVRVKD